MGVVDLRPSPSREIVSVNIVDKFTVTWQSEVEKAPQSYSSTDFWGVLHSFENESLWKYFRYDGNDSWITRGLTASTLDCISDGLYMQEVSREVCLAAILIKCRHTAMATVDKLDSADNCQGEILGAIMIQSVLWAASQKKRL